jgi:putative hemolysin
MSATAAAQSAPVLRVPSPPTPVGAAPNAPAARAFAPIVCGPYVAQLATDREQVRAAQRLRYDVFGVELGAGLGAARGSGRDEDRFDFYMDHLVVVDRTTGETAGAYRLQTADAAARGFGFYSASEFRLAPLKALDAPAVEVGRACVRKDRRDGVVVGLLWQGIAQYVRMHGARYVFGCCSVPTTDPKDAVRVFRRLRREGRLREDLYCKPHPELRCEVDPGDLALNEDLPVPPLFESYLALGAKVVSPPALDREFGVVDFLTLLDVADLAPRAARRFGF